MPLPCPPPRPWRETAILAAALCALKLALLGVDPTVRYFLGDSASYLHSALTGWIPPDRSFLYGWILRVSAVATHQIMAVTLLQSLFGVATACLVFAIARCDLGLGRRASASLALLLAIEPAQLFYERMLMAESAGTLCLIAMIAAGLAWLRRPHWLWPGLWALAGILAVALRMSLLPVVLGFALLPPLVAWLADHPAAPRRRLAAHLALAALATLCAHKGYQHLYGRLAPSRPDYIADSGYFRLGLVAPLVTPAQVARVGLPPDLLDRVGPPLHDPATRESQIWSDDGLIARVREAAGAGGNRAARKLAAYALREDPLGLVRMAASTLRGYFEPTAVRSRLEDDLGTRPLEADTAGDLLRCCGYDGRGVEAKRNPVLRWFAASTPWLTLCYFGLAPLALAAVAVQWRRRRAAMLLLALASLGQVAALALFSHIVSFRYLHPLPGLFLLALGGLCGVLSRPPAAPDGDGGRSTSAS
ncbi:MAG: glycosyltransferase family 39 protein [Lysobacterales bacterium]